MADLCTRAVGCGTDSVNHDRLIASVCGDGAGAGTRGRDSPVITHVQGIGYTDNSEGVENVLAVLASHGYKSDPVE